MAAYDWKLLMLSKYLQGGPEGFVNPRTVTLGPGRLTLTLSFDI